MQARFNIVGKVTIDAQPTKSGKMYSMGLGVKKSKDRMDFYTVYFYEDKFKGILPHLKHSAIVCVEGDLAEDKEEKRYFFKADRINMVLFPFKDKEEQAEEEVPF
ncbi:MAG: hypothetical protein D6710_12515 [Nitrospirae bacterium]|nr:MAG: hypothetical protein D6710_12515 [Nitrospirota bacterium]